MSATAARWVGSPSRDAAGRADPPDSVVGGGEVGVRGVGRSVRLSTGGLGSGAVGEVVRLRSGGAGTGGWRSGRSGLGCGSVGCGGCRCGPITGASVRGLWPPDGAVLVEVESGTVPDRLLDVLTVHALTPRLGREPAGSAHHAGARGRRRRPGGHSSVTVPAGPARRGPTGAPVRPVEGQAAALPVMSAKWSSCS